jgi:hypothetical protein
MFTNLFKHAPYYHASVNSAYSGMYAVLLWGALITQIASWQHADRDLLTLALFVRGELLVSWFSLEIRLLSSIL